MNKWLIVIVAVAGASCTSTSEDAGESGSSGLYATDGESSASTGALSECEEDDFFAGGEFAGPGWSPDIGLLEDPQPTYYAHSTWIQLKPTEEAGAKFVEYMGPAATEALNSEGLIGAQFGASEHCKTGRTLGVWRSREDMYRYVASPAHIAAIGAMEEFSEAAATTIWEIDAADLPLTFDVAIEKLTLP